MTHTLKHFASKAKPLFDNLDAMRDEALKRDRELSEINDAIDAAKGEIAALLTEAAEHGHSAAGVQAAASEKDEVVSVPPVPRTNATIVAAPGAEADFDDDSGADEGDDETAPAKPAERPVKRRGRGKSRGAK